jgi:hypothetical protein
VLSEDLDKEEEAGKDFDENKDQTKPETRDHLKETK